MMHLLQNKHWNLHEEYDKEKLLYLLIDRPSETDSYGDFIWKNNKNLWHRDYDLPSFIDNIGDIWWIFNNRRHRENNTPAYIHFDGKKEYWLDGKYIKYSPK